MKQDLRYALRSIRQNPLVTSIIVLTIALGIGANAAMFGVANTVLLKPLPFHDTDRLVHLWEAYPKGARYQHGSDNGNIIVRHGTYVDWKAQSKSYESMGAFTSRSVLLGGTEQAETLNGQEVDEGLFPTLGVQAQLGRTFQSDDFRSENIHLVVLADSLWRTRFGADARIVGKSIKLDNVDHTVIGVMPPGFYPTRWQTPQLWLPLQLTPEERYSRVRWKLITFARLKPGVSFDSAQREMDIISDRLTAAYPEHYDNMCAVLTPVAAYLVSQYEKLFALLLGAVGLLLAIVCANVTNLQLARAAGRHGEFAIRAALGGSRWQLMRQMLMESTLLAGLGAVLGVGLAYGATKPILALLPASSRLPRLEEFGIDWRVVLFTAILSFVTGVAFGLAPALRTSRIDLQSCLKDGIRGGTRGKEATKLGYTLIVGEMALAVMLLIFGSLLMRSFLHLMKSDPGLRTDRVLALEFSVPTHRYGKYEVGGRNPSRVRLFQALERSVVEDPGVQTATISAQLPFRHGPNPWGLHIVGKPASPSGAEGRAARNKKTGLPSHGDVSVQRVSPGYFETFGIRLLQGRAFDRRDTAEAPMVGMINYATASRLFGKDDPIGRTIVLDFTSYFPRMTVVGIVADSRLNGVDKDIIPQVFVPLAQWPGSSGWLSVRTAGDPLSVRRAVEAAIRGVDPDVSVTEVTTMETALADSLWRQRLTAWLLALFAGIAAVLAAAGIYGVFSYFVNRRTRELGIRAALGGTRRGIFLLVTGTATRLAIAGIALGLIGATAAMRLLATWFRDVREVDATTVATTSVLLLLIAVLASALPAWRATRVDPVVALREQ